MTQELSIMIFIDVQAALNAGTLDGNIYLIDNLKTEGSENEGTGNLISIVNGSHWFDGSQASEQLINWLPYSITCLSPSLPRFYAQDRRKKVEKQVLNSLRNQPGLQPENSDAAIPSDEMSAVPPKTTVPAVSSLIDKQGKTVANRVALIDLRGNPLQGNGEKHEKLKDKLNKAADDAVDVPDLSYLSPHLYNITGEAVEKGVIYPAQYGSPTPIKSGWYWCASVNTYMTGVYSYTMHITLYKPKTNGQEVVWIPVDFTYNAKLKITSGAMKNGFTGGGVGILPIR